MSTNTQAYIGRYRVDKIEDKDERTFKVTLVKEEKVEGVEEPKEISRSDVELNRDLYKMIVRTKRSDGEVHDMIRHVIATKILLELSDLDLEFLHIENVAHGLKVLAHNAREGAVGKKFGVYGPDEIKLKDIVDSI